MSEVETAKAVLFDALDPLLKEYVEREAICASNGNISYSVVELAKIDIADAVLRFLGVNPNFPLPIGDARVVKPRSKAVIRSQLRWEVWQRDNFTCKHCGSRADLSVDHIVAESKGGQLTLENLQTLCRICNSIKGDR